MGAIKLPEGIFGYEAAGIVRRVGADVTKVRVGDRVVIHKHKTFSTVMTIAGSFYEKMPDSLSFTEAASMPLVYSTAIYSLIDIGRLQEGQVS
jgi:NADPH:quinone reductase-like Zn-dependent oxidoreductase